MNIARIKELRTQLHLSQEYVANYLGLSRSTYTQMENGKRKVLADEAAKLSVLFGVSADSLLNDTKMSRTATAIARRFEKLDDSDKEEIINLIRFKEQRWTKTAQEEMKYGKWIPCSERLPEEETDVLVTRTFLGCKDGSRGWNAHIPPKTYVEVAQYFNGEWTALSDEYKVARNRHTNPVAWMPLPKPYREESEE